MNDDWDGVDWTEHFSVPCTSNPNNDHQTIQKAAGFTTFWRHSHHPRHLPPGMGVFSSPRTSLNADQDRSRH